MYFIFNECLSWMMVRIEERASSCFFNKNLRVLVVTVSMSGDCEWVWVVTLNVKGDCECERWRRAIYSNSEHFRVIQNNLTVKKHNLKKKPVEITLRYPSRKINNLAAKYENIKLFLKMQGKKANKT
jgi:hypothetical protein